MTQKDLPGRRGDLTLVGFLASALAAVVIAGGTYWLSLQQARAQDWVSHTHQVLATIAATRADLVDLQNGPRGYLLSGDEADLQAYDDARASIALDVARLRELTIGNPVQQRDVQAFEAQLGPRLATAAAMIEARRAGGLPAAAAVMDSPAARQQMPALRQVLQRMEAEDSRQLARRWDEHQQRLRAFWLAMLALLASLFIALALLYQQVRRRQAAQRSALEGEQQFHLMTDSVTDYAILKLDPEGRVRTWNPGAQRIHGWREAVGSPGTELEFAL